MTWHDDMKRQQILDELKRQRIQDEMKIQRVRDEIKMQRIKDEVKRRRVEMEGAEGNMERILDEVTAENAGEAEFAAIEKESKI